MFETKLGYFPDPSQNKIKNGYLRYLSEFLSLFVYLPDLGDVRKKEEEEWKKDIGKLLHDFTTKHKSQKRMVLP